MCLVVVLLLMHAPVASAQEAPSLFEISGGATFLGGGDVTSGFATGWSASFGWNATDWLGIVGEGGYNGDADSFGLLDVEADFVALALGARVSHHIWRLRPFAQLVGGATEITTRASTAQPVASVAEFTEIRGIAQIGVGVDVPITRRVAGRVAADYRRVFADASFGQRRVMVAAVVGLSP